MRHPWTSPIAKRVVLFRVSGVREYTGLPGWMGLHDRDRKRGRLSSCYYCTVMVISFPIITRTFFKKLHTYALNYTIVLSYNTLLVTV
jgi:hypothetical protein